MRINKLAKTFGVSRTTIVVILKNNYVDCQFFDNKKWAKDYNITEEEFAELFKQHKSLREFRRKLTNINKENNTTQKPKRHRNPDVKIWDKILDKWEKYPDIDIVLERNREQEFT